MMRCTATKGKQIGSGRQVGDSFCQIQRTQGGTKLLSVLTLASSVQQVDPIKTESTDRIVQNIPSPKNAGTFNCRARNRTLVMKSFVPPKHEGIFHCRNPGCQTHPYILRPDFLFHSFLGNHQYSFVCMYILHACRCMILPHFAARYLPSVLA